jgi:hypothetical protein
MIRTIKSINVRPKSDRECLKDVYRMVAAPSANKRKPVTLAGRVQDNRFEQGGPRDR